MKNFILIYSLLMFFPSEFRSQWNPLPTGGINNYLLNCFFVSADTGWIVGKGPIILKTTNGGNSWITQENNSTQDNLSVYFLDAMNGWVGGYNGGIYKTTDGGNTWSQKFSGYNHPVSQIKFLDSLTGYAVIGKWVGDRYGAIIHTSNGGENWNTKVFIDNYALVDLDFFDRDNGWAVGTNGLLYKTTDSGNSWMGPQFITNHWLQDVCFPDKYVGYAIGGTNYNDIILKTTDGGSAWSVIRQSNDNKLLLSSSFIDIDKGWVAGLDGTILMTTNGGVSWLRQETNISSAIDDIFMIDSVGYAVGELGKIYKYDPNYQYPLTVIRPNGGELWYTGAQKNISWIWSDTSNVTIEYSYGTGWNLIVADHPNTGEYLWTIPNLNTNQALVKISKADDSGVYDMSDYPFSIRPFIPVELVSFNASVLTDKIILTWSTATEVNNFGFEVQRSADNSEFLTIEFVNGYGTTTEPNNYTYVDDNVVSGKYYYRLKQVDFDGTFEYFDIVEVEFIGPTEFKLNQNYPNPFNPSTVISYYIPGSEFVTLKIFDMLGNEVSVLVNEEQPAGTHKIEFNSTALSSGTYFYRIQAGSFTETKKMILLK